MREREGQMNKGYKCNRMRGMTLQKQLIKEIDKGTGGEMFSLSDFYQ